MNNQLETIHRLFVNEDRRDAVEQIKEYGQDFWTDYGRYLKVLYYDPEAVFDYFSEAVIDYNKYSLG